MKIRYVGMAGVREIGPYVWNQENGYVQDVTDPAILEDVMTYPRPDFELVEETSDAENEKSDEKPRKGRANRKE
jgi:hypothetical protein